MRPREARRSNPPGGGAHRPRTPARLVASIAIIASIDLKSDEAAIHALARHLNVSARFFTAVELNAETSRLANPSDIVKAEVGCPGVAEGAALASAGPDAVLLVEKSVANRTTCAIARNAEPITDLAGTPQGRLFVVGRQAGGRDVVGDQVGRIPRT